MAAARQYHKELHVSSEHVDRWEHNPRTTKRVQDLSCAGRGTNIIACSRINIKEMNKTTFLPFFPNSRTKTRT
jgi:hypothetical protein